MARKGKDGTESEPDEKKQTEEGQQGRTAIDSLERLLDRLEPVLAPRPRKVQIRQETGPRLIRVTFGFTSDQPWYRNSFHYTDVCTES